MNRIIGRYTGHAAGPLVLVFGALHGNETAGVSALKDVFQLLQDQPSLPPGFGFKGSIVGVIGNLQAFPLGKRFQQRDLNRQWTSENIRRIRHEPVDLLQAEDREIAELITLLHAEILAAQPETLVLLDLHTTSAGGGIFCIPTDDAASQQLAEQLHAPVILGLFEGINGTLLRYAGEGHFALGGYPKHTLGVAFEAGQHEDPLSVSRSIAGILNCLRAVGCLRPEELISHHEEVLQQYSERLPKVTRLRYVHHIRPGDAFRMRPDYVNFQPIRQGEVLADDVCGPILAPQQGLILMPLYQAQGSDGFFIVEEV